MAPVRRIVLDVLKPHQPDLVEFARQIADLESVGGVDVAVIEIDKEVQNVKLTAQGDALDYDSITAAVQELGGTVHSLDDVACGEHVLDEPTTASIGPTWLR